MAFYSRDFQRETPGQLAIHAKSEAGLLRHAMNNNANKPWLAIDSEPSKSCTRGKDVDINATRRAFERHFLSKQELAFAVGVSNRTIDNWMAQKRIPFLRLSARLIRFNLEQVKAALARYEIKEIGAPRGR